MAPVCDLELFDHRGVLLSVRSLAAGVRGVVVLHEQIRYQFFPTALVDQKVPGGD